VSYPDFKGVTITGKCVSCGSHNEVYILFVDPPAPEKKLVQNYDEGLFTSLAFAYYIAETHFCKQYQLERPESPTCPASDSCVRATDKLAHDDCVEQLMNWATTQGKLIYGKQLHIDQAMLCLIDSNRGVYIPKYFIEEVYGDGWTLNVPSEELEALRNGPDDEWYWETWERVFNNAFYVDEDGCRWTLINGERDPDLFRVIDGFELEDV
jgi:hypothetical protein